MEGLNRFHVANLTLSSDLGLCLHVSDINVSFFLHMLLSINYGHEGRFVVWHSLSTVFFGLSVPPPYYDVTQVTIIVLKIFKYSISSDIRSDI